MEPMHPNPSCYWDRAMPRAKHASAYDMRVANIFHRDKPGQLVLQIRGPTGEVDEIARRIAEGEVPRRAEVWSEDYGPALWWDVSLTDGEIAEPPEYIGSPLSSDWPWDEDCYQDLLWVPLPKLARGRP